MSQAETVTRDEISAEIARRAWTDDSFRSRVLANPNAVFEEELGQKLPAGLNLKVIEDDANTLHFVIPPRPANTESLSDAELEAVAGGPTPASVAAVTAVVASVAAVASVVMPMLPPIPKPKKW